LKFESHLCFQDVYENLVVEIHNCIPQLQLPKLKTIINSWDGEFSLWSKPVTKPMKLIPYHDKLLDSFLKDVNRNLPDLEDDSILEKIISQNRKVIDEHHWHNSRLIKVRSSCRSLIICSQIPRQ
jgi:hypothetical protein